MPLNKKPFSTKMKKKLLKEKREKKQSKRPLGASSDEEETVAAASNKNAAEVFINSEDYFTENEESSATEVFQLAKDKKPLVEQLEFNSDNIYKLNAQPDHSNKDVNRYALQFFKESDEQMRRMKQEATKEYRQLSEEELEIKSEVYATALKEALPFPKRPEWSKSQTKEKLLANEHLYFKNYLRYLEENYGSLGNLSYFEMNLETWRQLWRTLEMSDIVLLITDIRYSVFHFPITLYDYIKKELNKEIILVLNKCDLISAELVIAWTEYWRTRFPDICVLPFASYAGMRTKDFGKTKGKRFGKFYMASESVRHLYKACEKMVGGRIDISDWEKKIEFDLTRSDQEEQQKAESSKMAAKKKPQAKNEWVEDDVTDRWTEKRLAAAHQTKSKKLNRKAKQRLKDLKDKVSKKPSRSESETEMELESEPEKEACNAVQIEEQNYDYHEFKPLDKGVLTIGCVGHPNVGKSSVLNAIIGKIVVSVSRTPGHTKHFQTIFLTNNVKLCDCPGLVFPSRMPKQLQILMGCFPIAQLREPYSSVNYIAERIDLVKLLKIKKSEENYENQGWSAMEICEQWATKRGYYAAKSARPDVYRAANQILRMALDGRTICLTFYPPDFVKKRDTVWKKHPDLSAIRYLQCQTSKMPVKEREFKTKRKNLDRMAHLNLNNDGDQTGSEEEASQSPSEDESSSFDPDELDTESELDFEIDM